MVSVSPGVGDHVEIADDMLAPGSYRDSRGRVFDLEIPFDEPAEAYRAMDGRRGHQGTAGVLTSATAEAARPCLSDGVSLGLMFSNQVRAQG